MLSLTCHITVKQLLKSIFNSGVPVKLLDRFPKNILTKRQHCNKNDLLNRVERYLDITHIWDNNFTECL